MFPFIQDSFCPFCLWLLFPPLELQPLLWTLSLPRDYIVNYTAFIPVCHRGLSEQVHGLFILIGSPYLSYMCLISQGTFKMLEMCGQCDKTPNA